jgi:putative Mn2+ efflux pump MntP
MIIGSRFGLLAFIGGKMVYESIRAKPVSAR